MSLSWVGVDKRGHGRTGREDSLPPHRLVESKFHQGFKSLKVSRMGTRFLVGEITRHPDTGTRTWWADS